MGTLLAIFYLHKRQSSLRKNNAAATAAISFVAMVAVAFKREGGRT
jgi:hypothetical protein